ncbi:MAG: nicotinate phosphoribosyltransferase, partial [Planctomycetota bacterium]
RGFLDYLSQLEFSCDVDAVQEGSVVFPHEPLIRVRGPLLQAQLIETALLTVVNFQTLIATKAARVCRATGGEPVLEFGLRRAQGIDGALSASWAAHVGGCAATSNVLAGKLFGIPVKGTHAHSWVMSFDSEEEAFDAYARALPNNCVFLVDTYDTIEGVKKATQVGKDLRERGFEMVGVRLDSGDLAALSIEARKILDGAGFENAAIVASNDLDEDAIADLKSGGAKIGVWGVGTKLVTAYDQPALGGVYKLAAIRGDDGELRDRVKLSEQAIKVSNPGVQQVARWRDSDVFGQDVIYDEEIGLGDEAVSLDGNHSVSLRAMGFETLLQPMFRQGEFVGEVEDLAAIRERARNDVESLPSGVTRLGGPSAYPVLLERRLADRKAELIESYRGGRDS